MGRQPEGIGRFVILWTRINKSDERTKSWHTIFFLRHSREWEEMWGRCHLGSISYIHVGWVCGWVWIWLHGHVVLSGEMWKTIKRNANSSLLPAKVQPPVFSNTCHLLNSIRFSNGYILPSADEACLVLTVLIGW